MSVASVVNVDMYCGFFLFLASSGLSKKVASKTDKKVRYLYA